MSVIGGAFVLGNVSCTCMTAYYVANLLFSEFVCIVN